MECMFCFRRRRETGDRSELCSIHFAQAMRERDSRNAALVLGILGGVFLAGCCAVQVLSR